MAKGASSPTSADVEAQVDLEDRPTALYRFYAANGDPLYFGIAVDPEQRWRSHEHEEWWPKVDISATRIDWCDNRRDARKAEAAAIKAERPAYNRQHADYRVPPGVPVRDARGRLADLLFDAVAGKTTYITSNGRRIAAVVPLAVADAAVEEPE